MMLLPLTPSRAMLKGGAGMMLPLLLLLPLTPRAGKTPCNIANVPPSCPPGQRCVHGLCFPDLTSRSEGEGRCTSLGYPGCPRGTRCNDKVGMCSWESLDDEYSDDYTRHHVTAATRWEDRVPWPAPEAASGEVNWVERGAVTKPTSQGRCATCQSFSCVADVEGAWFLAGNALKKLSEQEMIDCGSGDAYGMRWIVGHGGIASASDAPLANHSDRTLKGCRGITDCAAAQRKVAAYINGSTCLTNHDEQNILGLLQHGPVSVSISAAPLNGYKGGVINCTGTGIDHAVTLVAYGVDKVTGERSWTIKNSWGPEFGESSPAGRTGPGERGYARLKFGNTCLRGPCQAFTGATPRWMV